MRRIRITLAYDGTGFHGWHVPRVLQDTLSEVEGSPVHVTASGRTDAGVHALAQTAAFDLDNPIPPENLLRALNRLLPAEIRILSAAEAAPEFHPRYDAMGKTYEYRIYRGPVCSPFERNYVYHHPYPLNTEVMKAMAGLFEGQHDFSAFAAADEADAMGRSKVRTIFQSELESSGERLTYRVRGSGFLKHMVRNIVGTLIEAGKGNLSREQMLAFLEAGGKRKAGPRAPASGLFLMSVDYPAHPA
jgi:tRNA pseudouridine38-40 synthase